MHPRRGTAGRGVATWVVVLLGVALVACGADEAAEGGTGGDGEQVTAFDNVFDDDATHTIRIDPGQEVTWTNEGRNDHNIIPSNGGSFGIGEAEFSPGDSYSTTFDEPGVYSYYCSLHGTPSGGMVGTVLVGDVEPPPPPPPTPELVDIQASGTTIEVPGDHGTIQDAVDAAAPGDLILVAPGVYEEAVDVPQTEDLTIRGTRPQRGRSSTASSSWTTASGCWRPTAWRWRT